MKKFVKNRVYVINWDYHKKTETGPVFHQQKVLTSLVHLVV